MSDSELEKITKVCTRLRIFLLLTEKTLCVNAIVRFLDISQPAVSQHLKILRETDLVKAERRGYWMHYSANPGKIREFIDILSGIVEEKERV